MPSSAWRSEEHTSELQSLRHLVCRLLLENRKRALSENLTKRPLLRNFLNPLTCEEPTLVTAIRLAMDERHRSGWFERDAVFLVLRRHRGSHLLPLDEGFG